MALGSTQPLTEMSTRNFPRGKGRPAREADNECRLRQPPLEQWLRPVKILSASGEVRIGQPQQLRSMRIARLVSVERC
jgi:hypothetical protein